MVRSRQFAARPTSHPLVSVIIPARNEAANIGRLLESIRHQDYRPFEVIVYDDASTDGTGEIARGAGLESLSVIRGDGPPPGWVGKVHALYQATRHASGDVFLFLDADAELRHPGALANLAARWQRADAAAAKGGVLSGLPRLIGGGKLLVSLVPFALAIGLPMALVPRTRSAQLSSLNGQIWMISARDYSAEEPHAAMPDEVLEDVSIGRLLKSRGYRVELEDLREQIAVSMYSDHREAWRGFRKNVYLLQGGTPVSFFAVHGLYSLAFVIIPLFSLPLMVSALALKAASDLAAGFSWRTALLAPVSLVLSVVLPVDSAFSHWTGRVAWKDRRVGIRTG